MPKMIHKTKTNKFDKMDIIVKIISLDKSDRMDKIVNIDKNDRMDKIVNANHQNDLCLPDFRISSKLGELLLADFADVLDCLQISLNIPNHT